ncbi:uncharacterized protein Tco025E_03842 [Trypanosoma conorhini]|uniref:Uncharacterized protein n=1 Tax=Trypanosoma conorhini TaxID=83891 RepID=A0A422PR92_9TRYP|nr:uncharacterized protein Tco025E_03842 [Trypanosoma conorhini]RNF20270.1 hypothetical protein Tco025E_03842 [Trypanosoma conorhini]
MVGARPRGVGAVKVHAVYGGAEQVRGGAAPKTLLRGGRPPQQRRRAQAARPAEGRRVVQPIPPQNRALVAAAAAAAAAGVPEAAAAGVDDKHGERQRVARPRVRRLHVGGQGDAATHLPKEVGAKNRHRHRPATAGADAVPHKTRICAVVVTRRPLREARDPHG